MESVYLVQKGENVVLVCKSVTGTLYLLDGGNIMTLFTLEQQKEFKVLGWDRKIVLELAGKHNNRFSVLKIDLSKL